MNDEANKPQAPKPAVKPKVPAKIQVSWGEVGKQVNDKFECFPQPTVTKNIEAFLLKDNSKLLDLMSFLKKDLEFKVLLLINIVEYKECIQVIYQLQKVNPYTIICVKVNLAKDDLKIQSLTSMWKSADWFEREMWDMHGIIFEGHPNLVRILNPDGWQGFPMAKNYIPPIDALNGPITAVKGNDIGKLDHSVRTDVEIIEEINPPTESANS
ncbi:MAG: NADH-quinone oxidoreductase subunit C [Candidatus Caenarcaniphilales bacterium]|nr:NADH-quinone oxidoreductase subunit C [Candidatus Caenarcaniphilales bacterium]